jgi:hypothetical protein
MNNVGAWLEGDRELVVNLAYFPVLLDLNPVEELFARVWIWLRCFPPKAHVLEAWSQGGGNGCGGTFKR